jgi:hypothetical protein
MKFLRASDLRSSIVFIIIIIKFKVGVLIIFSDVLNMSSCCVLATMKACLPCCFQENQE